MQALNSGPASATADPVKPATVPGSNVDFLFGLDKGAAPIQPPPAAAKFYDPAPKPVAPPVEYQGRGGGPGDRVMGSDPGEVQRQVQQEMQRLQIADNDQTAYRRRNVDNLVGGYSAVKL